MHLHSDLRIHFAQCKTTVKILSFWTDSSRQSVDPDQTAPSGLPFHLYVLDALFFVETTLFMVKDN